MESFFENLRRELLDHVIVWKVSYMENLSAEYVDWYENHRLHQEFGGTVPNSSDAKDGFGLDGKIVSIPMQSVDCIIATNERRLEQSLSE